jgi:aryl-alcohol dehydrogenase-like predicted oxidoreductase/ferredoxin
VKINPLGKTGILVSELCFGTLVMGPLQANLDILEGQHLLEHAFDLGVTLFDTAHLYKTYPYFFEIPSHKKQNMVISSKSYAYTYLDMQKQIEDGLRAIGRDYFDVFMLHEQESVMTLKGHSEAIEAMKDAKKAGKIRSIGVSTHTVSLVRDLLLHPEFEVVHPIFNKASHGLREGNIEDMMEAVKNLYQGGAGIIVMKPLGGGRLYQDFLDSLKFTHHYPYKHSVACGVKNEAEIEVNIAIFEDRYTDSMLSKLSLKEKKLFYRRDLCALCEECLSFCHFDVISLGKDTIDFDLSKCVSCGYCIAHCPNMAIRVL